MREAANNFKKKWGLASIFRHNSISNIGNISSLAVFTQINMRMIEDLNGF